MISKLLAGVIDKDTLPLYMMSDSNKLQRIWWAKSLEWHDSHSLIFNIQTLWGSGNSSPFVHTIELKKKKTSCQEQRCFYHNQARKDSCDL
jgi:hypothetical protein